MSLTLSQCSGLSSSAIALKANAKLTKAMSDVAGFPLFNLWNPIGETSV